LSIAGGIGLGIDSCDGGVIRHKVATATVRTGAAEREQADDKERSSLRKERPVEASQWVQFFHGLEPT
jgi:hypothetical protein